MSESALQGKFRCLRKDVKMMLDLDGCTVLGVLDEEYYFLQYVFDGFLSHLGVFRKDEVLSRLYDEMLERLFVLLPVACSDIEGVAVVYAGK
jgi:hypothetical protein